MRHSRTSISVILSSLLCLYGPVASAEPQCIPTPHLTTARYPGAAAIPPSNNLLLPSGKSIESEGQRLLVHGQVLDKECKPVPDAVVELWQANPFGQSRIADNAERATPHPAFAGAGRTITDTDGQFVFTTAFPGVGIDGGGKQKRIIKAPQLNIRVSAPGMKDFTTVLYFENDRRNENDAAYKRLSIERRSAVTMNVTPREEDLYGSTRIVLPGGARYRTY